MYNDFIEGENYINDHNEIYNVINLTSLGGSTVTKEDVGSQLKYLVRTLTRTGLLNNSQDELTDAGNFLLCKFKDAILRFDDLN